MSESTFKSMISGFSAVSGAGDSGKPDLNPTQGRSLNASFKQSSMSGSVNSPSVPSDQNTNQDTLDIRPSMAKYLYDMYINTFGNICVFDADVLAANNSIAVTNAVEFDRTVSLESVSFIASYMALIFSAIVLDHEGCRHAITDAIETEIKIDSLPDNEKQVARDELKEEKHVGRSHCIELGVTVFSDELLYNLGLMAIESFNVASKSGLADIVNTTISNMTDEDRFVISMLASNYVYILRALNHNDKFFNTMLSIIDSLAIKYDYQKG